MSEQKSEAEAVADLVKGAPLAGVLTLGDGVSVLVRRAEDNGAEVESIKPYLDEYRQAPERKRGTATLTELASFISHVNREKLEHSAVFLDVDKPRLLAVYDYQAPAAGEPRFHEHSAVYDFPLSDEWKAWTQRSGKFMSQTDFAEFLEDHLTDVVDASTLTQLGDVEALEEATGGAVATPAQLLEVSRGLKVSSRYDYQNHETLSSGETQFSFENTHSTSTKGGAPLKVPTCFVIAIPVFQSGAIYPIAVKLRYRVGDGVTWGFSLYKPEKRIQAALAEAAEQVRKETALAVYYGRPETKQPLL